MSNHASEGATRSVSMGAKGAALFGKIPARPDFVRERFAGPAAQKLDQWLVKSVETLHASRATLPPWMVRYAFSAADEASMIIGVLSPSRDQVGRDFPVTVFCSVPSAVVAQHLAGLPLAFGPFLNEAEALIREVPALSATEVLARLDELCVPELANLPAATARASEVLRQSDAREHALRTLGDADGSAPAYAYHTFMTAAKATSTSNAVVLDCPIDIDIDLMTWLRLAERLLRGAELPSFFWTQEPSRRLLLSLGPASTQLLTFISDPSQSSARLWPLTTKRTEIADQVRSSLESQLPPLDRVGVTSIDLLIETLAQRSSR